MKVFKPPYWPKRSEIEGLAVFLGGSIEMGKAVEWQKEMEVEFKDRNVTFFNPRRDDWNPDWRQTVENPEFNTQVMWEMDHIDSVEICLFFIQGNTLSPITLGEIFYLCGIAPEKMIVACEPGFWRRGNIEVMQARHNFRLVSSLKELKEELVKVLNVSDSKI